MAGTVSYESAALSMQVLERRLDADVSFAVAVAAPKQEQAELAKMPLSTFQPVLTDNIFGARRSQVNPGGSAPAAGTAGAPTVPVAVKVPLNLTLTGTMIMGKRSFALIADATGRNEKVYRLWDCVPMVEEPTRDCAANQGKLIAVYRSKIVVRYQGERVTFDLATKSAATAAVAVPQVNRRLAPPPRRVMPSQNEASTAPFPMTQEGNVLQVRVPSAEVSKAFENFSEVLKSARVVPYTDATGSGFQIRNIRPGSIFDRIGLDNFDKIKAVNGEPITTADQALRLLTMFRNEREITLDLQRKDQPLQLNYLIQ